MEKFVIQGGTPLEGRVRVDGAKNAALPIMAASIAVQGTILLRDVPELTDITTMALLLRQLGVATDRSVSGDFVIRSDEVHDHVADYELVRRMRASICVLGPLLARFGKAQVSLPGGCNIGHRPVDLHLRGLAALGAELTLKNGYIFATADQLRGAEVCLAGSCGTTVTGTCNVMTAAALATGRTIIRSAACEPEVIDLGRFLNACGAHIEGLGTSVLEILGVDRLCGTEYTIIPDRIEAATLAIAAAATRGHITIANAPENELAAVLDCLRAMRVLVAEEEAGLRIACPEQLISTNIIAEPFPGIPTDTQAQLMALLCTIDGPSTVTDTVFPDRFMHVSELMRMGADLHRDGNVTRLNGGRRLTGASVMASDLRASAALVIAGMAAAGTTEIRRIYHLDRGYSQLDRKIQRLGASVVRMDDVTDVSEIRGPHFGLEVAQDHHMQQAASAKGGDTDERRDG